MKGLNFWLLSSWMVLAVIPAWVAGAGAAEVRTSFWSEGPGAAAGAQGGAFTAVADDLTAIFYNPAGLAAQSGAVYAEHMPVYDGGRLNFLAFHYPSGIGSFGLGVYQFAMDNIEKRAQIGGPVEEMKVSQTEWFLPYAFSWKAFSFGASFKKLDNRLDDHSKTAYGADAGVIFSQTFNDRLGFIDPRMNLAFDVRNWIRPKFTMINSPETLPRQNVVGGAIAGNILGRYSSSKQEMVYDQIRFSVDLVMEEQKSPSVRFGFAYFLRDLIHLYAGFGPKFSMGLGYGSAQSKIRVDYSFLMNELNPQHRVAFSYSFTDPKPQAGYSPQLRKYRLIKKDASRLKNRMMELGREALKSREYGKAAEYFENARAFDPASKELANYVARSREAGDLSQSKEYIEAAKAEFEKENWEEAFKNLTTAARVMPSNLEVHDVIAEARRNLSRPEEKKQFSAALDAQMEELSREFFEAMGDLCVRDARKVLAAAQSIESVHSVTQQLREEFQKIQERLFDELVDRAGLAAARREYLSAWEGFEKAAEINPDNAELKKHRAAFAVKVAKELGSTSYDRLFQDQLFNLAAIQFVNDDAGGAEQYLAELFQKNPVHEAGHFLKNLMRQRKEGN